MNNSAVKMFKCAAAKTRRNIKNWASKIDSTSRSETQNLTIAIAKKAISHPESKLLFAPQSGVKFIHYKDIFIKIDGNDVSVVNGEYSYHITIPTVDSEMISAKFRNKLENIQHNWNDKISEKINQSLSNVLNELSNSIK